MKSFDFVRAPDPIRPGTRKYTRFRFWRWYLTTAVLNLFDITGMQKDMETEFKIDMLLQGRSCIFRARDGNVYALPFANGGDVPVYSGCIISALVVNPVLGEYRLTPDTDCICLYLTPLDAVQAGAGLSALIDDTADALSDNDLSIRCVQRLKRLPTVFVGHTDPERIAMQNVINRIDDGDMNIVSQSPLSKSVERLDAGASNVAPLSEFTEYQQYRLGQFYTMLGVNSPWNTKRERVQAAENDANGETARYNIADIIASMNEQLDAANAMFGTDYHAELTLIKSAEIDAEIDAKGVQNDEQSEDDSTTDDEPAETG